MVRTRVAFALFILVTAPMIAAVTPFVRAQQEPSPDPVALTFTPPLNAANAVNTTVELNMTCVSPEGECAILYMDGQENTFQYTTPLVFADEGFYTLQAGRNVSGNVTWNSNSAQFWVDRTAPHLNLSRSSCELEGQNGWCLGNVTFALNASRGAGTTLTNLSCQVAGAEVECIPTLILIPEYEQVYTYYNYAPCLNGCVFNVTGEGALPVSVNATDAAGNAALLADVSRIDRAAPSPARLECTPAASGWCDATSVPQLRNGSDGASGIASQTCFFDEVATGCIAGPVTKQGLYTFRANATDLAGHSAAGGTFTLQVDTVPPTVTVETACVTAGSAGWCLDAFQYWMNASDATSGVNASATACELDGLPAACNGTVATEGAHALKVVAVDVAGNAANASGARSIDLTPPVPPTLACPSTANGYCLGAPVLVNASDAPSGVASATCATLQGETQRTGCVPATWDLVGNFSFTGSATDVAGRTNASTQTVSVDVVPPVVSIATTCASFGLPTWCRTSYQYDMTATDAGAGVSSVVCRVDGIVVASCVGTLSAQGLHVLNVTATDAAGNSNTTERTLGIDSYAPTYSFPRQVEVGEDDGATRVTFLFSEPMERNSTEAALLGAAGWTRVWDATSRWLNVTAPEGTPEGLHTNVSIATTATDEHGVPLSYADAKHVLTRGPRDYHVTTIPYGFVNITRNGTDTGLYCDDYCPPINETACPGRTVCGTNIEIPFGFTYFGRTYYELNVSPNGFITLGRSDCLSDYTPDPFPGTCPDLIAAYWEDLDTRTGVLGPDGVDMDRVLTHTIGEAPHRTFLVSWSVVHHYSQRLPLATFQIQLHEGTNDIDVHYERAISDGGDHMIGLINGNGTRHTTYAFRSIDMVQTALRFSGSGTVGDTVAPTVVVTGDAGLLATANATLVYTFSEAMDRTETLSALENATGWNATWDETSTVLTLTNASLAEGATTITLTRRAADVNGVRIAAAVPRTLLRDTTAPTVNVTGSVGLLNTTSAAIQLLFSEPMDRNATLAALQNATGWTTLWDESGTLLNVSREDVPFGVTTLTLTTAARDANGVPLAQPASRSVERTPPPPPPPQVTHLPAEPPEAPEGLTATREGATVTLAWSPPTQTHGAPVTSYRVYVAGALAGETSSTGFTTAALPRGATHELSVRAVNSAGEGRAVSTRVGIPPSSELSLPAANDAGWHRLAPRLSFTTDPADAVVLVDLGAGEAPYDPATPIPIGESVIRWRASAGGLTEAPQERTIRYDPDAPILGSVSVPATLLPGATAEIVAHASDSPSGVASVIALVGGAPLALTTTDGVAYRGSFTPGLGATVVVIVATDAAGNEARSAAHTVTVAAEEEPEPETPVEVGGEIPLEQSSTGGDGGQGAQPPQPSSASTTGEDGTPGAPEEEPQAEPEPAPAEIRFGDDVDAGARGLVTIRVANFPEIARLRIVLITPEGEEFLLSEGQEVTEWNTTLVADGFYTIEARLGPAPVTSSTLTIQSVHLGGETLATTRVLVRNEVAAPVETAAIVVGAVAFTAATHAGLSAAASATGSGASATLGGAGGFDPLGFAQEVAIDAGQDKLRDKTKDKAALERKRRIRSVVVAILGIVILGALWAFSETEGWSWRQWVVALPLVGTAAALVTLMKYGSESALAYITHARPRVRLWVAGTISLALSAIVFRNPFGYPAWVDETDESESRRTWKLQALRAAATLAGAAAFILPFLALSNIAPWTFVSIGVLIALTNLATSAMPFGPLPGKDIWRWNKWLAVGVALAGFAIYVAYSAALAPMWLFWALGLVGAAGYGASFVYFRRAMGPRARRVPVQVSVPVRDADTAAARPRQESAVQGGKKRRLKKS